MPGVVIMESEKLEAERENSIQCDANTGTLRCIHISQGAFCKRETNDIVHSMHFLCAYCMRECVQFLKVTHPWNEYVYNCTLLTFCCI